jgi:hypothetical protein
MGWCDYHLHKFRFQLQDEIVKIGIPDDTDEDDNIEAGWNVKLVEYFPEPGVRSLYEYDFGDCWQHEVLLEKVLRREADVKYPRCIAGKNACPPEDCGGPGGYADLRRILRNPKHEEYQQMMEWMSSMVKLGGKMPFDENNPGAVRFDNAMTPVSANSRGEPAHRPARATTPLQPAEDRPQPAGSHSRITPLSPHRGHL